MQSYRYFFYTFIFGVMCLGIVGGARPLFAMPQRNVKEHLTMEAVPAAPVRILPVLLADNLSVSWELAILRLEEIVPAHGQADPAAMSCQMPNVQQSVLLTRAVPVIVPAERGI